jgi:hypothetical protein
MEEKRIEEWLNEVPPMPSSKACTYFTMALASSSSTMAR